MTFTPAITLFVPGEPKAQPRARAFAKSFGGKPTARMYDPGTAEGWKGCIALAIRAHVPASPLTGPLRIDTDFLFPRPQSLMRRKDPEGEIPHGKKPDVDNLAKAVMDCLKNLQLFVDDGQVCESFLRKFYVAKGGKAGARICIYVPASDSLKQPDLCLATTIPDRDNGRHANAEESLGRGVGGGLPGNGERASGGGSDPSESRERARAPMSAGSDAGHEPLHGRGRGQAQAGLRDLPRCGEARSIGGGDAPDQGLSLPQSPDVGADGLFGAAKASGQLEAHGQAGGAAADGRLQGQPGEPEAVLQAEAVQRGVVLADDDKVLPRRVGEGDRRQEVRRNNLRHRARVRARDAQPSPEGGVLRDAVSGLSLAVGCGGDQGGRDLVRPVQGERSAAAGGMERTLRPCDERRGGAGAGVTSASAVDRPSPNDRSQERREETPADDDLSAVVEYTREEIIPIPAKCPRCKRSFLGREAILAPSLDNVCCFYCGPSRSVRLILHPDHKGFVDAKAAREAKDGKPGARITISVLASSGAPAPIIEQPSMTEADFDAELRERQDAPRNGSLFTGAMR